MYLLTPHLRNRGIGQQSNSMGSSFIMMLFLLVDRSWRYPCAASRDFSENFVCYSELPQASVVLCNTRSKEEVLVHISIHSCVIRAILSINKSRVRKWRAIWSGENLDTLRNPRRPNRWEYQPASGWTWILWPFLVVDRRSWSWSLIGVLETKIQSL